MAKQGRRGVTQAHVIKALQAHGGILTGAAAALGITRKGLSLRIQRSAKLQEARKDIVEQSLDLAEGKLMAAIVEGNFAAVRFYLRCKGRERGYIEKSEVTGADGGPIAVTFRWEGEGDDYHAPL